ncbi:hypothetical protein LXL04_038610 [Taraxacum kok-saghyz]
MSSIAGVRSSPMSIVGADVSSPQKRRLRSNSDLVDDTVISTPSKPCSPLKTKSPRRCGADSPNRRRTSVNETVAVDYIPKMRKSPKKKLLDSFLDKPIWNPTDSEQLSAVTEALHVSTAPFIPVCREDEQKRIVEFCKQCVEQEKAGSLYVCGCPGTGKSLSMENVKKSLAVWAKETGGELPEVLTISCTSLSTTSEIFTKVITYHQINMN